MSAISPLSPKDMLSLPRPSSGVPNPSGTLIAFSSSTYSFESKSTLRSLFVAPILPKHGQEPIEILRGMSIAPTPIWADDESLIYLRPPGFRGLADKQDGESDEEFNKAQERVKKRVLRERRDALVEALGLGKGRGDEDVDAISVNTSEMKYSDGRVLLPKQVMEEESSVELWVVRISLPHILTSSHPRFPFTYKLGSFPVSISDLSFLHFSSSSGILSFSSSVFPDCDLWKVHENEEKFKELSSGGDGLVYDQLFVRHWDDWEPSTREERRKVVFWLKLCKGFAAGEEGKERVEEMWMMESEKVKKVEKLGNRKVEIEVIRPKVLSPLKGTKLECPVGPHGGSEDWDVSSEWLVCHAKDPLINPAWHTRTNVYLLPLIPRTPSDSRPRLLSSGSQGACSSPRFSRPDAGPGIGGKKGIGKVAWLEMREDGYEADRNRVMVWDFETETRFGVTEEWDRSPAGLTWAGEEGAKLYLTAAEEGNQKLFEIFIPPTPQVLANGFRFPEPKALTQTGSMSSVHPLPDLKRLVLTKSSLASPNKYFLLTLPEIPKTEPEIEQLYSLTDRILSNKGLDSGEKFWFDGTRTDGKKVQGWILRPPSFDPSKKYPLAFLIHGGPQGHWGDDWSTRWNPNVFAAAGFVTVSINPTGSTGFGQKFCDDIKQDWGGKPFKDLVAGLEFVKKEFKEIDEERMAALGASYGGCELPFLLVAQRLVMRSFWDGGGSDMINWIQGHNDVMGFKCLVEHDGEHFYHTFPKKGLHTYQLQSGIHSTVNTYYSTEEIYFPEREFGGPHFVNPEYYEKWNPMNHINKWSTPQLIIHGEKDYRLPVSEGLGTFTALQRLGVPSRLLVFKNENHWVLNPSNSLQWHSEVLKWIKEWTSEEAVKKFKAH